MGKKMEKCKAPGCNKWATDQRDTGFCADHRCRLDPVSALYVDKTPEQLKADEQTVEFFTWLLENRTVQELLG
ncbi:MAG: hypothetical protein ACYDGS_04610 [Thermoleophilia bacterium]